jgi:hypothetical protein
MTKRHCAALLLAVFVTSSGQAWGYDIDLGPAGHLCDTCGGGVVGGLPVVGHTLTEIQAQTAGAPLEQWIVASHDSALKGALPIPDYIRRQLTGYASEDSMNRVRYKIGDGGFLNLARVLEQGGFASAVTLIDVVVFRGRTEANDLSIWAHELTHVDQYRSSGGVHSFAIQYARDYNAVENPAYAKGNGYWAWAQQQGLTPGGMAVQLPVFRPPLSVGAFCYTLAGRFGPGPLQPVGASCFVPTYRGPLRGQIGP